MFKYDKMTFKAYYLATTTNKHHIHVTMFQPVSITVKQSTKKTKQTHLKKSE